MPDIDLLLWNKVKTGDTEAFELLFRKYYPLLCIFSQRFTNDITTSREVSQDLFIYLWENRQSVEITSSLKSYLFTAVKFNSIRRKQNLRKMEISLDDISDSHDKADFHDHLEYAELLEKILEAITSLPDQCQKAFKLNRFHHLKYTDVAKELNISVKTVEAHISKALRLIQEYLNTRFILLIICALYLF